MSLDGVPAHVIAIGIILLVIVFVIIFGDGGPKNR